MSPLQSEASLRGEVAREVSIYENRASKELAVKLADEGRAKEASKVLRQQAAENAAAPAAARLPNVASENKKLEASASEVDAFGSFSKARRKQVQYENYQDKYQKR